MLIFFYEYNFKPNVVFVLVVDNSTETFWESGDEDRNKTKQITITCNATHSPRMIYVHIDNSRDLGVSHWKSSTKKKSSGLT